jgi:hydroxyacylglutathione hydrolase
LAASNEQEFVDFILEGQPEPPLYFARMKRDNRQGPKVLGRLPWPERLPTDDVVAKGSAPNAVIVDTRDRSAFMAGHIPGALLAPFNRQFNTIVGSYVKEDERIYLLIDQENVEEAVRDLIRIGLDDIAGYITPADFNAYRKSGARMEQIETISMDEAASLYPSDGIRVLDVRKASEFETGHIPNAVNIAHTRLLERLGELPADKTLLVHCRSGARAAVASALLKRAGYDIKYIDDHIDNWKDKVTI